MPPYGVIRPQLVMLSKLLDTFQLTTQSVLFLLDYLSLFHYLIENAAANHTVCIYQSNV